MPNTHLMYLLCSNCLDVLFSLQLYYEAANKKQFCVVC